MQINQADSSQLSLKSFWGLFLICGISCFLALTVFFCRVLSQFRRFRPEVEEGDIEEVETARSRRPMRTNSLKDLIDFVDRKETEIKEILKRKSSDSKRQASISSEGQSNSPS